MSEAAILASGTGPSTSGGGSMRRRSGGRARTGRTAAVAAAVLVSVGSPACDVGGDAGRSAATRSAPRDAVGVRVLDDPGAAWRGEGRLHLVRERSGRRLGRNERDAILELSDVRDLAPAPGGRLLVLDGREARVAVIDSGGRRVRYLGRRGEGPGELRSPDRVEPTAGGGVLVLERKPPAAHLWDENGNHVESRRLLSRATDGPPSRRPAVTEAADWGPRVAAGRAVRLVRLDPTDPSGSASTVHLADSLGNPGHPIAAWTTPGTPSRLPEVFGARRSWTTVSGPGEEVRIAVARGDRYEIAVYDTAGRPRTILRRDLPARPVTRALRERALERFVEEASRAGAPPSLARELRDRLPVSETMPVIGELWHSAPDGRLWVGLLGPGTPGGPVTEVHTYDVYQLRPRPRYMGSVPAPSGFRLHRVEGDRLYGSRRDSLDVPGIRVYRLEEPASRQTPDSSTAGRAPGRSG